MKTKAKKLFFFALSLSLSLYFTSCEGLDECFVAVDIKNIALILKLDISSAQRTRASIELPVETISATVHKMDIYCYNKASGIVYFAKSLTKDELTQAIGDDGLIISPLNSNVDAISIVANDTDVKNLSVEVNESIYTFFDKELDISLEQDFDNITYFGTTENLIQVAAPEGKRDDIDYFIALTTIKPSVARIELSNIICADVGEMWSNLRLNSVFIENVYQKINLRNIDNISNASSIPLQVTEADVLSNTQYWWIEVLEGGNATNAITATPWSPVINTSSESGVFVFNVFQTTNLLPTIGFYIDATVAISTRTSINQFMRFNVSAYTDDNINNKSFEVGHVYKINPTFKEQDITKFDDDFRDITLHITVQEWTIYNNIIGTI